MLKLTLSIYTLTFPKKKQGACAPSGPPVELPIRINTILKITTVQIIQLVQVLSRLLICYQKWNKSHSMELFYFEETY